MKRLALLLLLTAALLPAQDQAEEQKEPETIGSGGVAVRVIPIRNADPVRISGTLQNLMGGPLLKIVPSEGAIVVRSNETLIDIVEKAVRQLDVAKPPEGVELTMFLLLGHAEESSDESIPEALNPTIEQLKNVLPYRGYTLMDSMLQRGKDGSVVKVSSVAESEPGAQQPTIISLYLTPKIQAGSNPRRISLENLNLSGRIPVVTGTVRSDQGLPKAEWQYIDVGINTNLDVQEGQYTVVGKTGIGPDRSIVLVILAKVVN